MKKKLVKETTDSPDEKTKVKVRVRLDRDIVEFFKSMENYQDIVNNILRDHMLLEQSISA